jgi:hypothetical protein
VASGARAASERGDQPAGITGAGGGSAASPRATNTRRTASGSVTAPRIRRGPPQRSHMAHGNFRRLLFEHASPRALLDAICAPGFALYDQWEAQVLAMILLKTPTGLHSEIG